MKKLLAIALCVGMFSTAKSQVYLQGGVNLANISTSNSGATQKNNMLTSFNAGIMARSNPLNLLPWKQAYYWKEEAQKQILTLLLLLTIIM